MAIFTHLHKILQNPVSNRLYIFVHREGIETVIKQINKNFVV